MLGISDFYLNLAAGMITYSTFKQGEYIFPEGAKSDCFYGIIEGKVNICRMVKKEKTTKEGIVLSYFEDEIKVVLSEGMTFGEWGLVYKDPRMASAVAGSPEVKLFRVGIDCYNECFKKALIKSEKDRKVFLIRTIPYLKQLGERRLQVLYRRLVFKVIY